MNQNLDNLLSENESVQRYFQSLPDYVRQQIRQRGDNIRSEADLRRYADNLLENL